MPSKPIFLISFLLLSVNVSLAQLQPFDPQQYIEWNEFYKLSWDNFEAKPSEDIFGDAGTAVKIVARPYKAGKKIGYNVYVLFDRSKSWTFEKDPNLLAHEQLHFDIAEVTARRIRKKVVEFSARDEKDLSSYNKAINKLLEESNEIDRRYDMETLHGAIASKQAYWQAQIEKELKLLDAYKKQKQIIGKN